MGPTNLAATRPRDSKNHQLLRHAYVRGGFGGLGCDRQLANGHSDQHHRALGAVCGLFLARTLVGGQGAKREGGWGLLCSLI